MAICQKCSAENAPQVQVCVHCGAKLASANPAMAKTMVGMVSPFAGKQEGPSGASPSNKAMTPALQGTMMGMPAPTTGAQSPPNPAKAEAKAPQPLVQTMLGGTTVPASRDKPQPSPMKEPASPEAQAPARKFAGTLLGVAQPGIAPSPSPVASPPSATTGDQEASTSKPEKQPRFAGTLLGVAQPGITPQAPQAPAPPRATASKPADQASVPVASSGYQAPKTAGIPVTRRPLWLNAAFVVGGLALAIALGSLLGSLASSSAQVVVTEFSFDEEGGDQLRLLCSGCPEGSSLAFDGASGVIKEQKTTLHPTTPLRVGRNELNFTLTSEDGDELDVRPVILPVAYRQKANFNGRHSSPPHAEVVIEAPAGSEVLVNKEKLQLKDGVGRYRVELATQTTGEASKTESLLLELPVQVTIEGEAKSATARLKGAVTPLQLTSIGSTHQLGGKSVTIAGRTAPGATVTAAKERATADKHGRFTLVLESVSEGTLYVSSHKDRLVTRRVEISLEESVSVRAGATTSFDEIEDGAMVNVMANVLESRVSMGVTRGLLEVQKGCENPPCLIRALYAEPHRLRPNRQVRVFGQASAGDPITVRVHKFH